jgi:Fe-S oxidoreductase/nitrate reductase gamma subunit
MPIRETFWNIPHWAEISVYVLGFLTILVFAIGVYWRFRRLRAGKPERRTDHLNKRLGSLLVHGIGQARTAREFFPGLMHLLIFWGMFALLMGTILATIDWDVTHLFFGFQFLTGNIYIFYELVLDVLGVLLLVGLGMAAYRRYVIRPARLQQSPVKNFTWDDAYAIVMLALVLVTGYVVEGLRIAVTQPAWAAWSPVGNLLASVFLGMGDVTNSTLHLVIWVGHMLVAFVFIASIPFTKLFHILAAPANIFFRALKPTGALTPIREDGEPGVKTWKDFTWKQLLDFEACVRCGRCQDQCPSHASGLALSPRDLMIKLKTHMWEKGNVRALQGDVIKPEELWACTSCMACLAVCPVFTDQLSTIVDLRRHLVIEGQVDEHLQDALANLGRYGNSFGQSERMRARWTQPVEPKIKDARREQVEYLWFVGDYASYNPSLTEITQKTADVFNRAGLDYGILYEGERNAGNDVRRVGEEGLFEMLVEKNMAALNKAKTKAIVTTDPHSYNTLKNEYPTNGHGPVFHYSELLAQLIETGQLKLTKQLGHTVTYHDPCYLGRYNGIYDAPRKVIAATGCKLVEMPRHSERSYCCGAGGGRIWMDEGEVQERPSEARIREASALEEVSTLVVACPKDITMYRDAIKTTGQEQRLVVKDLIELVYEAM